MEEKEYAGRPDGKYREVKLLFQNTDNFFIIEGRQ
jgi:hypothetical protein